MTTRSKNGFIVYLLKAKKDIVCTKKAFSKSCGSRQYQVTS